MSNRRPTNRDRLEREFLARAKEFSDVRQAQDAELLAMQRELGRIESPRERAGGEKGPRRDGLDVVPECKLSVLPDIEEEVESVAVTGDLDDWKNKAIRMTSLLIGVCNLASRDDEDFPKLVLQMVKIAADLPGAASMRNLAEAYGYSPERISQRVEEIQRRFNLPKNQHNKSAAAVQSYKVTARMNQGAA